MHFKVTTSPTYHSSSDNEEEEEEEEEEGDDDDDDEADRIAAKIKSLGLKIPEPLKVPPNIKTPSA
jgi:hypothetical protein